MRDVDGHGKLMTPMGEGYDGEAVGMRPSSRGRGQVWVKEKMLGW